MRRRFMTGLLAGLRVVWPILSGLIAMIVLLGLAVGALEGWSVQESIYFSFITALTIGYGDHTPTTLLTRSLAIFMGICGVILTSILAAVAVKAMTTALDHDERPTDPN